MVAFLSPLLAANAVSGPIKFDLVLDQQVYAAGQPILASLTAKNISNRPAVLAKAIWDGAPAATANATLMRNGKPVETFGDSSITAVQVIVDNRVDKSRFVVLQPNQTVTLYWVKFEGERVFRSQSRDKQAYAESKAIPLAPGRYECVVRYEFDAKKIGDSWKREWMQETTFERGARSLWNSAQEAAVRISQPLRIK